MKSLQADAGKELDALLPAILDRAFNGEVMTPCADPPSSYFGGTGSDALLPAILDRTFKTNL